MKPRRERLQQEHDRLLAKLVREGGTGVGGIKSLTTVHVLRRELRTLNFTIAREDEMTTTKISKQQARQNLINLEASLAIEDAKGRVYVRGSDGSYLAGDDGECYANLKAVLDVNGDCQPSEHMPTLTLVAGGPTPAPEVQRGEIDGAMTTITRIVPPTADEATASDMHPGVGAETPARTAEKPAAGKKAAAKATASAPAAASPEAVLQLPIGRIIPNPANARKHFDLAALDELAASIQQHGIIEPLIATGPPGPKDEVQLVAGERRLRAAALVGLTHVPVIVRTYDQVTQLATMAIENLQREDLSPLEEARAYQQLIDTGLNQHQVAELVGRGQGTISKRLALLGLAPLAAGLVARGVMPVDAAVELAKAEPKHQEAAIKAMASSYRRLEDAPPHQWRGVGDRAKQEAKKDANAAKKRALLKQLKDEGVTILAAGRDSYYFGRPGFPWRLGKKAGRYSEAETVDMTPKQHSKFDCHAAYIVGPNGPYDSTVVHVEYLCTDPAAHMDPKAAKAYAAKSKKTAGQDPNAAAAKARSEELRKVGEARDAHVAAALKKIDKAAATKMALELLVLDLSGQGASRAAHLLGIPVSMPENSPAWEREQRARKPIYDYCNESDANLIRAAAALGYVNAQLALERGQTYQDWGVRYAISAEWMAAIGYQLSEVEQAFLERVKGGLAADAEQDADEEGAED